MKHVVYITGTRADYGLMRKTLLAIQHHSQLKLTIIATGMHLMPAFGHTLDDIQRDGFHPLIVDAIPSGDGRADQAAFFAALTAGLSKTLLQLKADYVLVLGDRPEMLAAAAVAMYFGVPVVHVHGGERSSTVDEYARHAITKLSRLHFVATKASAERVAKLGEDSRTIIVTGAPGLDGITDDLYSPADVERLTGVRKPFALVLQHPVSDEIVDAKKHMTATLTAVRHSGLHPLVLYPNADPGSKQILRAIQESDDIIIKEHVPRKLFLSLLRDASVLVGNSSAGIIEAASFKLPVVNIGTRQNNRERSTNVVDAAYTEKAIQAALKTCLSLAFKKKMTSCKNIYGDGNTSERIAKLLATHTVHGIKQITY